MKTPQRSLWLLPVLGLIGWCTSAMAGTWSDDFSEGFIGSDWQGDRDFFSISDGALRGVSAQPLAPVPLHKLEVGKDWSDYTVQCRVDVVEPNLLVCTKGALVLRDNGTDGYVFALHVATKTIEVYRLSNGEMLLSKDAPLQLTNWYALRAELYSDTMRFFVDDKFVGAVTDDRSLSGRVGVAVQDALSALFDDFIVTGPNIPGNGLNLVVGQKATLSWPGSLTNYVLQASSGVSVSASWNTLTNAPTTNGDQLSITVEPPPGPRFYRLVPARQ